MDNNPNILNDTPKPGVFPASTNKGIGFNPFVFFVLLLVSAIIGLVPVLKNPYGYPSFAARVREGFAHHDAWMIACAVLTGLLLLWLLLALVTGRFTRKNV